MNLSLDYINQNSNLPSFRPGNESIIISDRMKNLNVIVLQYYMYEGALEH